MRTLCCALLMGCPAPTIDDSDPSTDGTDGTDDPVLTDFDGDGFFSDVDCDDFNPDIRPDASEVLWNGEDDNCDGRVDADGRYAGRADVVFVATVEGRTYRWDLDCPTSLTRTSWTVDFEVLCEPPAGDPVALAVMGQNFSYAEKENVAEEASFSGVIVVSSSDGWLVEGQGSLVWRGDQRVDGEGSMRSRFAQTAMSFTVEYTE